MGFLQIFFAIATPLRHFGEEKKFIRFGTYPKFKSFFVNERFEVSIETEVQIKDSLGDNFSV